MLGISRIIVHACGCKQDDRCRYEQGILLSVCSYKQAQRDLMLS